MSESTISLTTPRPDPEGTPFGYLDCDDCGAWVLLVTNPRHLVIVLCADCNKGNPIR